MTVLNSSAGRNGFVRGVVSRRHGGVAFPLDLVRVVAGVVNRGGWRRRVAAEFRNYLVTDSDDSGPVFSARRSVHAAEILPECVTGAGGVGFCCEFDRDDAGGPIDAPYAVPSGSMRAGTFFGGFGGVVQRSNLWRDAEAQRYAKKYREKRGPKAWRQREGGRIVLLDGTETRVNGLIGGDCAGAERVPCMDAPDYVPAGSVYRYEFGGASEYCAAQRTVFRAGWFE